MAAPGLAYGTDLLLLSTLVDVCISAFFRPTGTITEFNAVQGTTCNNLVADVDADFRP